MASYSTQLTEWRSDLKGIWLEQKRGQVFTNYLIHNVFTCCENPFETVLELIRKCPDYTQPKTNSMAATIFKEFHDWVACSPKVFEKSTVLISESLQFRAFRICTGPHTVFLETGNRLYRLTEIENKLLPEIIDMVQTQKFKEAAHCAALLGLQEKFTLEEIVLPCLLQDRHVCVELYLQDLPAYQTSLTELLDSLCSEESQMHLESFFAKFPHVEGIRKDKFKDKTLKKLVARLVKLYNIPTESVPNLTQSRSQGALRYLFFKRYTEKSMEDDNWDDMIREAVSSCPGMEEYLLSLLVTNNDISEAARWAVQLKIPHENIPESVIAYLEENPSLGATELKQGRNVSKDGVRNYLKLPFDLTQVLLVDSRDKLKKFYEFLANIIASNSGTENQLVGLDSEWRPMFGNSSYNKVALLQVSIRTSTFLIDFIALEEIVSKSEWDEFFRKLFCEEKIRKLGFQFDGDMLTLVSTVPSVKDQIQDVRNVVCLAKLIKKLRHQSILIVSGLTEMIQRRHSEELSSLNLEESMSQEEDSLLSAANASVENGECSVEFSAATDQPVVANAPTEDTEHEVMETPFHFKLTDLCEFFLGKPLEKVEQFSNWARRPLRPAQVHYAALDAYCEIELYDKLKEKARELGLDFEKACQQSLVGPPKDRSIKGLGNLGGGGPKKSQAKKWMERAELMEMIKMVNKNTATNPGQVKRPGDVKVVCDKMFQGLGKHLRRVGVDCLILENQDTTETAIEYAKNEQRIILSSGNAFLAVASRVPKELCACIPGCGKNGKKHLAWALEHFRIRVTEADIFSRCMMCNCAEYIFVPRPYIRVMWDSVVAPSNPFETEPFDRFSSERQLKAAMDNLSEDKSIVIHDLSTNSPEGYWIVSFDGIRVDLLSATVLNGEGFEEKLKIGVRKIPTSEMIEKHSVFFVCAKCGKVYWDGSHMPRYVEKLGENVNVEINDEK